MTWHKWVVYNVGVYKTFRGVYMNIIYAKTILQIYGVANSVIEQLDELAERKALASMVDFSPCLEQCYKILEFTRQKDLLLRIKELVSKILCKLTNYDLDCLDYKYFKKKPKSYYKDFDFTSRKYFRTQVSLIEKVAKSLEKVGFNDSWFEQECLSVELFKEMFRRVKEKEQLSKKNKSKKEKQKDYSKKTPILDVFIGEELIKKECKEKKESKKIKTA